MKTKFITFYYDYDSSNYYKNSEERLRKQIESFGGILLSYNPQLTEDYSINCLYKPKLILEKLKELKEDLIWIDVDCYMQQLPIEMDSIQEDVGIVLRTHDMRTPHSGLLYFKYNEKVLSFVEEWSNQSQSEVENVKNNKYLGTDHNKLVEMFLENKFNLSYKIFSPEIASTNYSKSKVLIGISPGGWAVERKKHV